MKLSFPHRWDYKWKIPTLNGLKNWGQVRATTPIPQLETIISQAVKIENELHKLLEALKPPAEEVPDSCGLTPNTSDQAEENFRHIQPTNNPQLSIDNTCNPPADNGNKQNVKSGSPDKSATGAEYITLAMAKNAPTAHATQSGSHLTCSRPVMSINISSPSSMSIYTEKK